MTDLELQAILPHLPRVRRVTLLAPFVAACGEFDITTPLREAAFLAQLAHESGELRYFHEVWGPTAAQLRYDAPHAKARELGNVRAGDGYRFRGRGPIQITGRANYRSYGEELALDLENLPEIAADPKVGFRIAGAYWRRHGLNDLADVGTRESFRAITKAINGGRSGEGSRERYYERARGVLGLPALPTATE